MYLYLNIIHAKMAQNLKIVGYALIGFSAALFIALSFIKVQVDEQSAFLCERFHDEKLDMKTCPVHQANSFWTNVSWMLTSAFGIDFLILAAGVYLGFIHKPSSKDPKKDFKEIDISSLDGEEQKVYGIVKSKEGSSYQSDLIKETGFSKVKMTRILDRLESKGILERKRRGMTNIAVLK